MCTVPSRNTAINKCSVTAVMLRIMDRLQPRNGCKVHTEINYVLKGAIHNIKN